MKRRRLKRLALVIALAAVVTLPWWQQIAVYLSMRIAGVEYSRYESVDGGRFHLHDLDWASVKDTPGEGVRFQADEVEMADLVRWAWTRQARMKMQRWKLVVAGSRAKDVEADQPSATPADAVSQAARISRLVTHWVGRIETRDGLVKVPGDQLITIPRLDYLNGVVTGVVGWRDEMVAIKAEAGEQALVLEVVSEKHSLRLHGELAPTMQVTANLQSTGDKAEGQATLEAAISDKWRVRTLKTRGENWRVPSAKWDVAELYQDLTGTWSAEWDSGAGKVRIEAGAEPRAGKEAPPVKIALEAGGDLSQVAIRQLELHLPKAKARLAEPFVMDWGGRFISKRSLFDFDADLTALPLVELGGHVSGRASFAPGPLANLAVDFSLDGSDLTWKERAIRQLALEGELRWPEIVLRKGKIALSGLERDGENGVIELSGRYHATERTIADAVLSVTLPNEALVKKWLPAGVWPAELSFGAVEASVRFAGSIPDGDEDFKLQHEGKIKVQSVRVPPAETLKPLSVSAEWGGTEKQVEISRLRLATEDSELANEWVLSGDFKLGDEPEDPDVLTIRSWSWLRDGALWAELVEPVTVQRSDSVVVSLSPLRFGKKDGFSISAGGAVKEDGGHVQVSLDRMSGDFLMDWLSPTAWEKMNWAKGISVDALKLEVAWQGDGAMTGSVTGQVGMEPLPGESMTAAFDIALQEAGVELRKLSIHAWDAVLCDAKGRFPVSVHPGRAHPLDWHVSAPLDLDVLSSDDEGWNKQLANLSGIKLSGASIRAKLSGTLQDAQGNIQLKADTMEIPEDARRRVSFSLPSVTNVGVEVALDHAGIRLKQAQVTIDEQPISLSGFLPISPAEWLQSARQWVALAKAKGECELHITEAKIASIARYMPTYLAPAGVLSADITYGPQQRIEGTVTLDGASSRPLGPLGVLQQIEARIRFQDRSIVIESIRALAGGQPVTLTGGAEWPRGQRAVFDARLRGENAPFVRQSGLVVRGDLDLTVKSDADDPKKAKISGEVHLRDSVYLSDLTSLLPTGVKGAARRPPYFSVEDAPFKDWELDVALRGDRFMRVRLPVFEGVVSAQFNLTGTLGNPRAVGEARIARGRVILPFAVFTVQEGASVRLTESSPYEPRLMVTAAAQRFDYDLRMELSGTAEAPVLQFFSSPALDSEQILLLVMAGVAPSENSLSTNSYRLARFGTYLGADMLRQLGFNDDSAERLTVQSGEKLSRMGKETYSVDYSLGGPWSLFGEYDEFDAYNAGIKWRYRPAEKEEKPDSAPPKAESTGTTDEYTGKEKAAP